MTRPPRTDSPATDFAVALLGEFARLGVRHLVLSPGSRSQALALAAAEYDRIGALTLHVRIDERVAGFTALGLARESGAPVLVVTTSGSAAAHLHPAVLEAHHSGVPLILLTADRPAEMRGIGANQTTQQVGMFLPAVPTLEVPAPESDDDVAAAPALARRATESGGPVHIDIGFREPLSAAARVGEEAVAWTAPDAGHRLPEAVTLVPDGGTVVIAGADAGEQAERVARELGAPLLAEVSSGARFGPHLVAAYRELLDEPEFGGRVRRAVVFGHPTLSRQVPRLIERADVETVVVRGRGPEDYNPGHAVRTFADAVRVEGGHHPDARSWVGRWVHASRALLTAPTTAPPLELSQSATPRAQAGYARAVLQEARAPIDRRMLVEAVWAATWPHDRLVLGASRLIREADRVVPGKRIRVHANRGLAGIDGTVATATGVALAAQSASPRGTTRVLLGDLALLHDSGALLIGPGEPAARVHLIVGNDGGGTIFDSLEVAGTADPGAFDRVMLTPHGVRLEALAEAYGWEHRRATTRSELSAALTAGGERVLIEVPLER